MTLLGLELSDVGIMVAGGEPAELLDIDEQQKESPGFAIQEKNRLLVGKSAAGKAHIFPFQIINKFWDQLNTRPLQQKNRYAQNHAEIACAHLSHIWENARLHGNEIIVAVPDYYGREQLGLILGMAQEMSIPVKGFISLPIAASFNPCPDSMLLHMDIHLHRFEISYLHQDKDLTRGDSISAQEINMEQLQRLWVESIAEEFVHTTRFDPLHQAATEQDLYNRLPGMLENFKDQSSIMFEISNKKQTYQISLLRDMIIQKSDPVYGEICRLIEKIRNRHGKNSSLIKLQLTHRIACLPGLKEKLLKIDNCETMELEPGAGALGALQFWNRLADKKSMHGASFFTSRPWGQIKPKESQTVSYDNSSNINPTHILYHDLAYPLSAKPVLIGSDPGLSGKSICVLPQVATVSGKHCMIQRDAGKIILTDFSRHGTFIDNRRVEGVAELKLGQTVGLGTSDEILRIIACIKDDEA